MKKRLGSIPTVAAVRVLEARGPWETKSGGPLNVLYAMPFGDLLGSFFSYPEPELSTISGDIRGFRAYTVDGLPQGRSGGNEWHKVRQELVFGLAGSMRWVCEDLNGGQRVRFLGPRQGMWLPRCIPHSYEVLEEGSAFLVIANTLFDPYDPRTHDTYSLEAFRALQAMYANSTE